MFKAGFSLIGQSIQIFIKYPKLIVPLLITWSIFAPIVIYLKFFLNVDQYSTGFIFALVFLVVFVFAFLLAFSCTVLLEMVQQIEQGNNPSLIRSFGKRFGTDMIKIMPIVFIWAIIWFVLLIINALLSRRNRNNNNGYSAEQAAETLAGYGDTSIWKISISALQDGIRMLVFLILPGIVWEGLGFGGAIKKGFATLKSHPIELVTGYLLTETASFVLFFPPAMLFFYTGNAHISLPDYVWYLVIIYCGFAWSYVIYLEQMFTSQFYLWNMIWEKQVALAKQQGKPIPKLEDISEPDLLDDDDEFSPDNHTEYDPPIIDTPNLPPTESQLPPKMYNPSASAAEHGEES